MRKRIALSLVLTVVVIVLDVITKHQFPNSWHHYQDSTWEMTGLPLLLVPIGLLLYAPTRIAGALLLGGVIGNVSDCLAGGGVSNPFLFVLHTQSRTMAHTYTVAFNVSDVALYAGLMLFLIATPRMVIDTAALWRGYGETRYGTRPS